MTLLHQTSIIAPLFEKKICEPILLERKLKKLARPLVFTNGCFDILHRGHVTYLAQARNLGKSLVVAVNSDDSIHRLEKGSDRPINTLGDRVSVLAAIGSITLITWFDEINPLELIKKTRPDILVKGGDWSVDKIVGADFVNAYGGTTVSIPIYYHRSTSKLIKKIRNAEQ